MTEEAPVKAKPAKSRKFLLVRYGRMKTLGLFEHNETDVPRAPSRVVVKTDKGLEMGEVAGRLCPYKDGRFRLSEEQVASYYVTSEIQFNTAPAGKVVRFATPDDLCEERHLQAGTAEEIESCKRIAGELGLRMKIIDAEHIFGGERIVFYFMAEGRVDFRELVRKLAQEYQTRIEMRQVGSRDEAKLLGDVESCGRECCCLQFLQQLKPVNMRMAKMQKATLDPSKISGYCGRLKCCLRYEDQTYTELKQSLPKRNTLVQTDKGEARVIDGQILTQLVVVEYENGDKACYPLEELTMLPASAARKRQPQQEETAANGNRRENSFNGSTTRGPRQPGRDRSGREQRRPDRNERTQGLQEPPQLTEELSEVSDEKPQTNDGMPAQQGNRPANGNRQEARSDRPPNRGSRRSGRDRRGREQRRPARKEWPEAPEEPPEVLDEESSDRNEPQQAPDQSDDTQQ